MTRLDSQTISVWVNQSPSQVYEFIVQPENLPLWASGLGELDTHQDGVSIFRTPEGPVQVTFVPRNALGVLDHVVTPESGLPISVPLRVLANGSGSEVALTLFRQPAMSDAKFAEDRAWVERDLETLKRLLEAT